MEYYIIIMEIDMKEIIKMVKKMEKEYFIIKMEIGMKENLKMEK